MCTFSEIGCNLSVTFKGHNVCIIFIQYIQEQKSISDYIKKYRGGRCQQGYFPSNHLEASYHLFFHISVNIRQIHFIFCTKQMPKSPTMYKYCVLMSVFMSYMSSVVNRTLQRCATGGYDALLKHYTEDITSCFKSFHSFYRVKVKTLTWSILNNKFCVLTTPW